MQDVAEKEYREPYPVLGVKLLLQIFLNLLVIYAEESTINRSFYASEKNDLLSVLYTFYPAGEFGAMFYPLLTTNRNFV